MTAANDNVPFSEAELWDIYDGDWEGDPKDWPSVDVVLR